MKTLTPRCQYAGSSRIRCLNPACDYCADKRDLVRRLSAMTEDELAAYCAPRLYRLVDALLEIVDITSTGVVQSGQDVRRSA